MENSSLHDRSDNIVYFSPAKVVCIQAQVKACITNADFQSRQSQGRLVQHNLSTILGCMQSDISFSEF